MKQQLDAAELRSLPIADRLKLIEDLWDSIDPASLPLPGWHRSQIDHRLGALDKGASVGAPWEEVRNRIASKP